MSETLELTKELIRRKSVTPDDAGCQACSPAARACRIRGRAPAVRDVDNFWAIHRGGDGPVACFAGHTDVVPPGPREKWLSDPFEPVVRDGLLYGRGAADMKSGVAAMTTAALEFVAARPAYPGSIAFVITSDEEGRSVDGTRRVVDALRAARAADRVLHRRRALEPAGLRRHRAHRPARLAVGPAHRAGRAGPRRLSRSRAEPDPRGAARASPSSPRASWDAGDAHFPPTQLPGQQRPVRHRRDQRDPRRAARRRSTCAGRRCRRSMA